MNAWDGTYLFQWEAEAVCGGDANKMIEQAKQLGLTGVLLKFANGSLAGDPVSQKFMADFKRLAQQFKAAGLKVGGWIYQYLTDPAGEVEACVQAVAAGADFIVLDAEDDVKSKNAQVTLFGQLLRAQLPHIPIGLSSYAIADYHKEVPFDEYMAFVDFTMPQIYWADMGWDVAVAFNASVASYRKFGKPIAPTGQAYGNGTSDDMAKFVQLSKAAGFTGISWWDWQHAAADQLAGIKANIIAQPVMVAPQVVATTVQAQAIAPATGPSKDVPADRWSAKVIAWALSEGIMHNDANGNFNPDSPLTREQAAALMYSNDHRGN